MRLQFLGANNRVTGSCTRVMLPSGKQILIDCGIMQDSAIGYDKVYKFNSKKFEFNLNDISHVIFTHAHLDHIGKLPLLVKRGYKGKILATEPTAKLASINLKDAAYLMDKEARMRNKRSKGQGPKYKQLYAAGDVDRAIDRVRCYSFGQVVHIDKDTTVEFLPNGHIVGSAMIRINYIENQKNKSIVFTGDTSGFSDRHPFVPPAKSLGETNTIITESTYGKRSHDDIDIRKSIENSIRRTCLKEKKTLLLPVFSIQRSTELSQIIYEVCKDNDDLRNIPIYLDSPMAVDSTEVINDSKDFWAEDWRNRDTFFDSNLVTHIKSSKASKGLANGKPKIILSSSGMMQGGRILHHLISFLPSKGCTVLLTGYCGEGTLAYNLLHNDNKSISILGRDVAIRADIENLPFSSHADQDEITDLIKSSDKDKLDNVFIIHGNKNESSALRDRLKRECKGVKVRVPKLRERFKI